MPAKKSSSDNLRKAREKLREKRARGDIQLKRSNKYVTKKLKAAFRDHLFMIFSEPENARKIVQAIIDQDPREGAKFLLEVMHGTVFLREKPISSPETEKEILNLSDHELERPPEFAEELEEDDLTEEDEALLEDTPGSVGKSGDNEESQEEAEQKTALSGEIKLNVESQEFNKAE